MDLIYSLSGFVLAQADAAEPVAKQSVLSSVTQLGVYGLLIPLCGFAIFIGACLVVALNRHPAVIASYLVFLPLPVLIGVVGTLHGTIMASYVVAMMDTDQNLTPMLAEGFSVALFATLFAFLVSAPSYAVLSLGLFLRTLAARPASDIESQLK